MTANGEKFRPDGITAAHKTLPLPSYVEVTSLQTGRTILVRVNDRGPFARGRIIDLSKGAAEQLGIRAAGTAPVRVRVVDPRSEEHTSELQSLMRISYAVFCLKKKTKSKTLTRIKQEHKQHHTYITQII